VFHPAPFAVLQLDKQSLLLLPAQSARPSPKRQLTLCFINVSFAVLQLNKQSLLLLHWLEARAQAPRDDLRCVPSCAFCCFAVEQSEPVAAPRSKRAPKPHETIYTVFHQRVFCCFVVEQAEPVAAPRSKRAPKPQETSKARALDALASLRARGGVKGGRVMALDSDEDSRCDLAGVFLVHGST
jgi:hypothetical protein